jgi:hypothetical protein
MKKQVELTDDVTKEFLSEIFEFILKSRDKVKTSGDCEVLEAMAAALYETIAFYNEDDEEIDIVKAGGLNE